MWKFKKIIILLLFFALSDQYCDAQKLTFDYLTVKDGLPQNTVQSITKDKFGFMWFGTFNGLCRYDGYKFKIYNTIPGDITSLANNRVHYIYKDKSGTLWVATFDSYVCRYNYETDNFTRYRLNDLPQWLRDSTNRLRNVANLTLSGKSLQKWIGDFKLSPTKEHVIFQGDGNNKTGLDDNNAYCVYRDNCDILWIGTSTGGINRSDIRAKPFHNFNITTKNRSSMTTGIRAIETDGAYGLWLGTLDAGLVYVDQKKKIERHFEKGPLAGTVRTIYKDSFGDVWIGYRTGLDKYDPRKNTFTHYFDGNANPASTENRFFSIAEDPQDHSIWFGTVNHVMRYDRAGKKFETLDLKNYVKVPSVMCLFFDSKQNLWIGTEYAGIIELKRNGKHSSFADTVVFRMNDGKSQFPDNRVYSINEDESGNIWAGTGNGLVRIGQATGITKVYTKSDGLADQYISKVLPDKNGNIWITHKKGLSKLIVKTNQISNYDVSESLLGYQFMDGSGCMNGNTGTISFGGTEGYVSFNPKEIHDNPYPPTVALTELQILNSIVDLGQKVNGRIILTAPINLTRQITLSQADRSFSLEFSALHYSNPGKNRYAYMLEGSDKNWIYTDASRRFAAYSNLREGKYTFKVKAANCDGLWNGTPATLEIVVLPPLWRTWWAYVCYVLFAILTLGALYKLILTRQRYHHDIMIEKLKADKAAELEHLKSQFFTNISHEFRTPLTLIIEPLETLLSGKIASGQLQHYYQIMHRNSRRLLGLINQFLDLRKLESGNLSLNVKNQDIVGFVQNTMAGFELHAKKKELKFSLRTELKCLDFGFDPDMLDKVLYNLLSNAFKFAAAQVVVSLDIDPISHGVLIAVADDGPGFPPEIKDKIFEPFYQADDNEFGGTGVGLSLVIQLVKLHQGTISASSSPGIKTCFTIRLPDLAADDTLSSPTENNPVDSSLESYQPGLTRSAVSGDKEDTKILIVEDNDDIRNYLIMSLAEHYTIIEAENGNDGLSKAIEFIPELIISDVMMPGLNGINLCRMLKTDERTSHIPVILLTARQSTEHQIEGYETGADAYITKPFSTALLIVRIQNLLESRKKLRELFDRSTGFDTRLVTTNAADQAFMDKLNTLIVTNMADGNFNVEWIAEQMFLSRTQLYRKIKSLTGLSVHDFVTTIKLKRASDMLLEGSYTVSEIAFLVGYSDPTNFSRNFQKQFGQTPKKYSRPANHD